MSKVTLNADDFRIINEDMQQAFCLTHFESFREAENHGWTMPDDNALLCAFSTWNDSDPEFWRLTHFVWVIKDAKGILYKEAPLAVDEGIWRLIEIAKVKRECDEISVSTMNGRTSKSEAL